MSLSSYKRNTRVYYITRWSYEKNGAREWKDNYTFSSTPEDAIEETKKTILFAPLPSFKVRVVGYRIE
jgi:hypothetical protein